MCLKHIVMNMQQQIHSSSYEYATTNPQQLMNNNTRISTSHDSNRQTTQAVLPPSQLPTGKMTQEPTREELLKHYDYLDRPSLVQTMSDIHIRVLREDIGDEWKELVPRLGLEEKEVKLIDLQEQREVMKRHAALHKWKRKFGRRATYLRFLDACMLMHNVDLAERMLDLLNEHMKDVAANNSSRLNTSSSSRHDRPASRTERDGEYDILSLSYTSVSSRGSIEIGDWLPIEQRVEELRMKYKYTIEVVKDYFEKNITPETIAKRLLLMPQEIKELAAYLKVKNAESDDAFSELLRVSDYRQNEVLHQLVVDVGDDGCKRAMALYQDDSNCFNSDTTLGEFTRDWLDRAESPELEQVTLTMGGRWESRTLQELEDFKKKLQRRAHFNTHDLQLRKVQSASVQVTLTLASEYADISNFKLVDYGFYKANSVLRITAGGTMIYNVESPKHYEFLTAPPTHLMCPIMKHIMVDPQKTRCCNKHISREAADHCHSNGDPCPFCSSPVIETRVDLVLQDKTRAMKIYCPYKHEGCHWEGEIRYLQAHLHGDQNPCHYSLRDCQYSCGASTQRYAHEKHVGMCPIFHTPLQCQYCGEQYPRNESHDLCPELPVSCPYGCGEWMPQSEVTVHLKVCSKLQIKPRKDKKATEEVDYGRLDEQPAHRDSNADRDDPNFLPDGYKLLCIAKKMLMQRSKLPDNQLSLLETKLQLKKIEMNKRKSREESSSEEREEEDECEEMELRIKEAELETEEECIEREMTSLRSELRQTHREIRNRTSHTL